MQDTIFLDNIIFYELHLKQNSKMMKKPLITTKIHKLGYILLKQNYVINVNKIANSIPRSVAVIK